MANVASYVDFQGFKFFRCDVEGRLPKHGVGLHLKPCLEAVEADVELQMSLWLMFL